MAAFTANFGNGITSTLSLEEPRRIGVTSASLAGQVTGNFNPNGLNIRTQFNDPFLVGAVVPQGTGDDQGPGHRLQHAHRPAVGRHHAGRRRHRRRRLLLRRQCHQRRHRLDLLRASRLQRGHRHHQQRHRRGRQRRGSGGMRASRRQARMGGHRWAPPQRARRQLLADAGQLHPRRAALHQPYPVADRQRRPLRGRQLGGTGLAHGRHLRQLRGDRAHPRLGHLRLLGAGVEPEVEDLHLRRLDLGELRRQRQGADRRLHLRQPGRCRQLPSRCLHHRGDRHSSPPRRRARSPT